jgi:hypothetical protein
MVTYYSSTVTLWGQVVSLIEEIAWLSGKVYKNGAWKSVTEYPQVCVDFVRDGMEPYLLNQGSYYIQPEFDIIFQQTVADNKETQKLIMVSGYGAIIDKVQAHTANCPYWERIQVIDVDPKWYSPGMAPAVIEEAKIRVRVKKVYP